MKLTPLPDISIVVCAYNGESVIQSCLNSLISQTAPYESYEVLIVDDGSTDSTFEVASNFVESQNNNPLSIHLARINHVGLSMARNSGIELSKGGIIAYIDQDAVADKFWVAELMNAWEKYPDADAIGGEIKILNPSKKIAQFLDVVYYEPGGRQAIIGANMSFKKGRLLEVGAFGDIFISRGDETFLLQKMGSDRKEIKWHAAVVYHEMPTSIKQWLKERISNGKMNRLISNILGDQQSVLRSFLVKRLFTILAVLLLLVHSAHTLALGLLLLPVMLFIKGLRQGSFNNLGKVYNGTLIFPLTLFWELLNEVGIWLFYWGRWRGERIIYIKEEALRGTVSKKYVEQEISNK